jgi:uncharacterized protein YdaU (DUF1376 family)
MAALPYIQLYVADYLADTAHLTTEEHGAYLLLIMNYWQRGKPLPNNDERLARIARLSNERWTDVKQTIEEFFNITSTEWRHARIDKDLNAVNEKSKSASEAGLASAKARKAKKETDVEQTFNARSTDVEQTFNHTNTYTDTNKDKRDITPSATSTPEKTKKKTVKTSIPGNFSISDAIRSWYEKQGYKENIDAHLVAFIDKAIAKNYTYADWDAAFRTAIRDDWAKLRVNGQQKPAYNGQSRDWSDDYWRGYKVIG